MAEVIPKSRLWPGIIFAFLGFQMLFGIVSVTLALRDKSFAVESNYYQKALHWDSIIAEEKASAALGWTCRLTLVDAKERGPRRRMAMELRDAAHQPIEGASVKSLYFHHAHASEAREIEWSAQQPGRYEVPLLLDRDGEWELRLAVRRGQDRWSRIFRGDLQGGHFEVEP